jgi:Ner family transcriptional regulator
VLSRRVQKSPLGWHNADIVAALKRKGFTQRGLSAKHRLSPSAVSVCLQKKWPKVEQIIADELGVPASDIWPPRYPSAMPIKRGNKVKSSGRNKGETLLNNRSGSAACRKYGRATA